MVRDSSGRIRGLSVIIIMISLIASMLVISLASGLSQATSGIEDAHDASSLRHYKTIDDKILSEGSADVIIIVNGHAISTAGKSSQSAISRPDYNPQKRSINGVMASRSGSAIAGSTSQSREASVLSSTNGFEKHHNLTLINGYSGRLDRQGLQALRDSGLDIQIYEDKILYIHDDNIENISDTVIDTVSATASDNIYDASNDAINASDTPDNVGDNASETLISGASIDPNDSSNASDVNADGNIATDDPSINSALNIATAAVNANYSWNTLNITGSGVKVALIDTGVDYTHPALGGCFGYGTNTSCRVFDGYDFYNDDNDPMDDHTFSHGTHVAGIVGANGSIRGMAPNATIYALKACSDAGFCSTSTVVEAMGWARDHGAQIISLSVGSYVSYEDTGNNGKDPFAIAVDNIIDQGILVVVSAGNDGPGTSTINTPGASEKAITVGAVDDKDTASTSDDSIWLESSRGPSAFGRLDPEICAPGYQIQSTARGGSYMELTGTSMAAPFISGAAALLLEKYPGLTPIQIKAILMQSTNRISGKAFERGTGELDIGKALTAKVYALVNHTDTYGREVLDEGWEFVITPYTTSYANITIRNDNDYNVTFNITLEPLENMENGITLNTSQLRIAANITVLNNSNYTLQANFTLDNFSAAYATTYGGVIFLNGSGYDSVSNNSKTLRIPVVITIPILNYASINRTLDTDAIDPSYTSTRPSHEDVYFYAYYNNKSRDVHVNINWTSASDWLSLYLYNSTGDFDMSAVSSGVNTQSVSTSKPDAFKWVRIDGYDFNTLITFNMSISDLGNHAPSITNITDINGAADIAGNSTSSASLGFFRPNDITINVSFYDADNDSLTVGINDSSYNLTSISTTISSDGLHGVASFKRAYNSSIPAASIISVTFTDPYAANITQSINISMRTSISIVSYSPSQASIFTNRNNTLNFTVDAFELSNKSLYYYWKVNNTLNVTTQNFTFNSTAYTASEYAITLLISNNATTNATNETLSWDVHIDSSAPNVSIESPVQSSVQNNSHLSLNYTVTDNMVGSNSGSGLDRCWYSINSSNTSIGDVNMTLQSCGNGTIDLANGAYSMMIYSNDSVGNIGRSSVNFSVNDSSAPLISGISPSGTLGSGTASVLLSVNTDENATCRYAASDMNYDSMPFTFTDDYMNHTAAYSVSAGTAYTFYVRCSDMSNNTNNESSQIAFRIDAVPVVHSSGGGSSGGGGGGGGGGVILLEQEDPDSVTTNIDELAIGENNITLPSDRSEIGIPISRIGLIVDDKFYDVKIVVKLVNDSNITYDSAMVYAYISIEYDNIVPSSLKGAKIYFEVPKDWIATHNFSGSGMQLAHYDAIYGWNNLSAQISKDDEQNNYYDAYSPDLGTFAITHENISQNAQGPGASEELDMSNLTDIRKDSTLQMHEGGDGNASEGNGTNMNDIISTLLGEKSAQWVVYMLLAVFIIVAVTRMIVRRKDIQAGRYGKELLKETRKEFKDADKQFEKMDELSLRQEANILFKAQDKIADDAIRRPSPPNLNNYTNNTQIPRTQRYIPGTNAKYSNSVTRNLGMYRRK